MKLFTDEKQGMEMSMNVIIVSVIALLILVILVFLISAKTDLFVKGSACASAKGVCKTTCENGEVSFEDFPKAASSCGTGKLCCNIVGDV